MTDRIVTIPVEFRVTKDATEEDYAKLAETLRAITQSTINLASRVGPPSSRPATSADIVIDGLRTPKTELRLTTKEWTMIMGGERGKFLETVAAVLGEEIASRFGLEDILLSRVDDATIAPEERFVSVPQ